MESKSTSWIWVRGLARETAHWWDFESHFRVYFPDVKIEFLDVPGNGRRWNEKSKLTIAENTEALRASSELIRNGERPFILSISMGSMIAMDWAYRYSDELQGVVCMNTSLGQQNSVFQRLRPRNYLKLLAYLVSNDKYAKEKLILEMTTKRKSALRATAALATEVAAEHPVRLENLIRQTIAATRFKVPNEKATRPFLFLNSLRDEFVDPSCTAYAAKLVGGELHTHPTAGHDLSTDDGPWVARQISDWVSSLEGV